jgi:hypothetical protein
MAPHRQGEGARRPLRGLVFCLFGSAFSPIARAAAASTEDDPSKSDKSSPERERDRYERDLDQYLAAAHRASGADANVAIEKLAKTRTAHWPARIMCTERRSEEKQREKDREKQGHDDKEIVNLWVPSEGEPACHNKPYCSAHSDLDYDGMNTRLSAGCCNCGVCCCCSDEWRNSGRETSRLMRSNIAASELTAPSAVGFWNHSLQHRFWNHSLQQIYDVKVSVAAEHFDAEGAKGARTRT